MKNVTLTSAIIVSAIFSSFVIGYIFGTGRKAIDTQKKTPDAKNRIALQTPNE